MKRIVKIAAGAAFVGVFCMTVSVQASLTESYQFNGTGNWSIDAVGSNSDPVGTVSAVVPAGSTIEKAFLYSAQYSSTFVPDVLLAGISYSGADWTYLGMNDVGLSSYRTDVTVQIAAAVGTGGAVPYTFEVKENTGNSATDGELLAIIYSNPGEVERTIAILDGYSDATGDSFAFNFADPLVKDTGFEALMSLGIGFGFQGTDQVSLVDVNGTRLTSSAGGYDDGVGANGGLITAGGIGDSTANPADPNAGPGGDPRYDDELYDLDSFLSNGDTSILVDTLNPSNDDNIFFTAFNITAEGDVRPPSVPDGGMTLVLLGMSLTSLAVVSRRRS